MTLLKALLVVIPAIRRIPAMPMSDSDWERVFAEFRTVLETRLAC